MKDMILVTLKAVLSKLSAVPLTGAHSSFAKWLVRVSAQRMIMDRDRYLEEWLANLEDRKTPLRKIRFAVGICWAARQLRRDSDADESAQASALYKIRIALLQAKPEHDTVTGIAAPYGIRDWALFACKYKETFGEYPARTLHGSGVRLLSLERWEGADKSNRRSDGS